MNALLSRALSRVGLIRMAAAVVDTSDESPEAVAQAMAKQVDGEVAARVADHPIIVQCEAYGIKTAGDFVRFSEEAALGRTYLAELRSEAKAAAVRAYGPEDGPAVGAQVDAMGHAQVKMMLKAWNTQADAKFGITDPSKPAARASAPSVLNESLAATGTNDSQNQTAWQRLTPEQRAMGEKIGMKTPEKQEAYALEVLKGAA